MRHVIASWVIFKKRENPTKEKRNSEYQLKGASEIVIVITVSKWIVSFVTCSFFSPCTFVTFSEHLHWDKKHLSHFAHLFILSRLSRFSLSILSSSVLLSVYEFSTVLPPWGSQLENTDNPCFAKSHGCVNEKKVQNNDSQHCRASFLPRSRNWETWQSQSNFPSHRE